MPLSECAISGIRTASLGASQLKANVSYSSGSTVNALPRPGHGTACGDTSCLGQRPEIPVTIIPTGSRFKDGETEAQQHTYLPVGSLASSRTQVS